MENMNKNSKYIEWAFDVYGKNEKSTSDLNPVVILHGVLDCKENWKNVAETICETTGRMVYVLDLPNHGETTKFEEMDFKTIRENLKTFLEKLDKAVILIGHSAGAIISIFLTTKEPNLVHQLVIIDISPSYYPIGSDSEIVKIIHAMRLELKLLPTGSSLNEAKEIVKKSLKNKIQIASISDMIVTSLTKSENGFEWKMNLDSIEQASVNQMMSKAYPLRILCYKKTLLIYGGLSHYVRMEDQKKIKTCFPNITIRCVQNANHCIHFEKPEEMLNYIFQFVADENAR